MSNEKVNKLEAKWEDAAVNCVTQPATSSTIPAETEADKLFEESHDVVTTTTTTTIITDVGSVNDSNLENASTEKESLDKDVITKDSNNATLVKNITQNTLDTTISPSSEMLVNTSTVPNNNKVAEVLLRAEKMKKESAQNASKLHEMEINVEPQNQIANAMIQKEISKVKSISKIEKKSMLQERQLPMECRKENDNHMLNKNTKCDSNELSYYNEQDYKSRLLFRD